MGLVRSFGVLVLIFSSNVYSLDRVSKPGLSRESMALLAQSYECCDRLVKKDSLESWLYVAAMAHNETYLGMQNNKCREVLVKYFNSLNEQQQCAGKCASGWANEHFSTWRYALGKVPFNADPKIGMRHACKSCF